MLRPDRSLEEFHPQTTLMRLANVICVNPSRCSESTGFAGWTSARILASDDTYFVIEKRGGCSSQTDD